VCLAREKILYFLNIWMNTDERTVARIQLPAPTFSAAAVVDGVITQVDLASYKGAQPRHEDL
jgi:hypothetical protein